MPSSTLQPRLLQLQLGGTLPRSESFLVRRVNIVGNEDEK